MAICDNPHCRYHLPMPGSLPWNAPEVTVLAPAPPQTVPCVPGAAPGRLHTVTIRRHLYRRSRTNSIHYGEFHLCGECHEYRQRTGLQRKEPKPS